VNASEELLRCMRLGLAHAQLLERQGNQELAEAAGARAANKLALAVRVRELETKVVPLRREEP